MRAPGAWLAATLAALAVGPAAATLPAAGQPAAGPRGLDIHWVDVEGGAATLIVTPAGESILLDSGWPGDRDAERIRRAAVGAGLGRIDHLVTTHWHRDHVGGVEALAARMPIGRYYDHGPAPSGAPDVVPALQEAYARATGGDSTVLRPGDAIRLRQSASSPRVSIEVVAAHGRVVGEGAEVAQTRPCHARPAHEARPDDPSDNARSVGLLVRFGAFDLLSLGDLTWNVEHRLVCPRNRIGEVDVYQVTHHGLDTSNHPAVLAAARPRVSIVNNGPRKGGRPAVYAALLAVPGPPDVFQLHRNVESAPSDNAPPAHVANDGETCRGHGITVRVDPDGARYSVHVEGKGTTRTYASR